MPKRRLDTLLAERGLFETRTRAAAAVMAGDVRVGDRPARKPGELVARRRRPGGGRAPRVRLARRGQARQRPRCASASTRPAGAPSTWAPPPAGFTDCLLQRGAEAVIALDVAYGELHWTLRNDPRVTVRRAPQRALARAGRAALGARPDRGRRLVHLAHARCCPRCSPRRRRASTASRSSSRSSRSGASGSGRAAWCARPPTAARRWCRGRARPRRARGRGARLRRRRGCPGPAGNRESFVWLAEAGRAGAIEDSEAAARRAEP